MPPLDRDAVGRATQDAPSWLRDLRIDAYDAYRELPMPEEKEEQWRYVDLGFDLGEYRYAEPSPAGLTDTDLLSVIGSTAGRALVANGVVSSLESDGDEGPLESLSSASASNGAWLESVVGRLIPTDHDKFTAANRAFATDGIALRVPPGRSVADPYYVEFQAGSSEGASFPYVAISVEDGAEASIIVNCRSAGALPSLVVPQLELVTGANSHVRLSVVQNWGFQTTAIAQFHVSVGRDSTVRFGEAGLGGRLSRLHLTVELMGRGSSAEVVGSYFGELEQTLDYRYFMRHVGENTRSDMFLKGAVEDSALSVFTGLIRIEEEAQRTDAFQTNRNLILSEGAAAQSVPNLEILANDVRCGHGSTVGPLDAEQRYYLMSRGLDAVHADRLQVRGFFEEALQRFPAAAVAAPVREWINHKFIAAQEEGRV